MGLCTQLAPELNPMQVIRPYLERFVLGPDQDWAGFALATTKDLALSAVALPGEMRRFLSAAQRGQLEFGFRNMDDAARLVYVLGHQVIWVLLGISASILAVVFDGRGEASHARMCWWAAAGAGILFLGSLWSTRNWLRRRRNR